MTALLLDTHAWVWSLNDSPRLPARTREALAEAEFIIPLVSADAVCDQLAGQEGWPPRIW